MFARYGLGLRVTDTEDVFHNIKNMVADATSEAGCNTLRFDTLQCARLRWGPFSGQGRHSVLKSNAREMRVMWGSDNPVFQILYFQILERFPFLKLRGNGGSQPHLDYVFVWVCDRLESMACGSDVRSARWWDYEQQSRAMFRDDLLDIQLLSYMSIHRKWYKDFSKHPLCNSAIAQPALPDVDPVPLPGEVDVAVDGGLPARDDGAGEPAEEIVPGRRESANQGRLNVARNRAACTNGFKHCLELLCNDLETRVRKGLLTLPIALEAWTTEAISKVKTRRGAKHLISDLVGGELSTVVLTLLKIIATRILRMPSASLMSLRIQSRNTGQSKTPLYLNACGSFF